MIDQPRLVEDRTPGHLHWLHIAHPIHGTPWKDLEPLYRAIAERNAARCAVCDPTHPNYRPPPE